MYAAFCHFRRYCSWALFGALILLAFPIIYSLQVRDARVVWPIVLPIALWVGGSTAVVLRALTGMITGWQAHVADRALAVWMGRFFIGWLLAIGPLVLCLSISRKFPTGWGPIPVLMDSPTFRLTMVFAISGGIAMLFAGWLLRWKWGRFGFPIIWYVSYFATAIGFLAANSFREFLSRKIDFYFLYLRDLQHTPMIS